MEDVLSPSGMERVFAGPFVARAAARRARRRDAASCAAFRASASPYTASMRLGIIVDGCDPVSPVKTMPSRRLGRPELLAGVCAGTRTSLAPPTAAWDAYSLRRRAPDDGPDWFGVGPRSPKAE